MEKLKVFVIYLINKLAYVSDVSEIKKDYYKLFSKFKVSDN